MHASHHRRAGGHHDHHRDAAAWDHMYRQRQQPWTGEPTPFLNEHTAGLTPGTALDLACGEGRDAVWLAQGGWRVTAVDFSAVALERGRAADTLGQVTWLQADMLAWEPPVNAYDLVSLHFVHIPVDERPALLGRLARAIRPQGLLLMVAHHPSDLETTIGRPPDPDLYFTADAMAAMLVPGRWEVLVSGTRPNQAVDRDGQTITIQDMVLKVRRSE